MNKTYPPYVRWMKPVCADPAQLYGKKNQKRIRSTLGRIEESGISHELRPLDDAFLEWFGPWYQTNIGSKRNAAVHDLRAKTLENTESLSEYWCLELLQNGERLGGTILGVREDRIMIAYRTYQQKWNNELTLQANPSLYTEYLVSAWAYALGKEWISHGKDRNPYGLNANIGLAIFKLSVGCSASIALDSEDYTPLSLPLDSVTEDALILESPTAGAEITKATLWVARENEQKYAQLSGYSERLTVEIIYRD